MSVFHDAVGLKYFINCSYDMRKITKVVWAHQYSNVMRFIIFVH